MTAITLPWPPSSLSGHAKGRRLYSAEEEDRLRSGYRSAIENGRLLDLAEELGRSTHQLCDKARALGLTDRSRHARGFAGKRHTEAARQRSRDGSINWWASLSPSEKEARVVGNLKAAIAKNGYIGAIAPGARGTWKAGWREVGDKRNYYRSRWEANYGRYLQWLKSRGEIADWQHEPETFWFEAIKRGVRSYLPDFRVWENDGSSKLHEVKGWMDSRSKTTLRRMAKYHPGETIVLIQERDYNSIARQLGRLIDGWETSDRADRP